MRERGYSKHDRQSIVHQLDDHSNRIKELLRADLTLLQEENAVLKVKCKKVNQLEDKIESILKQNSQLLNQNERLSKLLHQKKQQVELVKDKYQSQISQKMSYATQFQFQKKKFIKEIDQLQNELKEVEHIKNTQLNQLKSQYQIQIQSVKRQSASTQDVYEQQIRKLRQQMDKKDYQLSDLSNKLKRISSQTEYEIIRLRQQKDKLKNQLLYVESDRKKQIEVLRSRLQSNYAQEIQTIKKSHFANLDGFQVQNLKLKELLQKRNSQIDQLNTRINKQKVHYQESIIILRKENDTVRSKLIQYERLFEAEKEGLKFKLTQIHENQLADLRANHQKYIECLQAQIFKFQKMLSQKNQQIQQLIKQKASIRQMFDSEGNRYKQEIQSLQQRLKQSENKINEKINYYQQKLNQKDQHISYLDKINADQAANFENQLNSLKEIIEHQKKQLDSERINFRQKQQNYKQTISQYKAENQTLKDTQIRERGEKNRIVEELTSQFEMINTQLKAKVDSLTSKANILQKQNKAMKQTIQIKERQIKNLNERFKAVQDRQKKLQKQNDELRTKLIRKDQKTNQMLAEQKERLQSSFAYTLQNLKSDHESAMKLQANRYNDMKQKLRRREIQLEDLLKTYKKMRDGMQALTQQQSNKKDMTLKFPGATADLIATKNLFDIYLKTKVLTVCGDVSDQKQKENVYKK